MGVGKKKPGGTREHLLDAAERLFADLGIEAASLRRITRKARANLAAAHYHFGSKRKLVEAVILRRIKPLNEERLRRLDEVESKGTPSVEGVLRAFLMPSLSLWQTCPHFVRLAGRIQITADRALMDFFYGAFREVAVRFGAALAKALPEIPEEDLFWRSQFLVGSMIHIWTSAEALKRFSGGRFSVGDGRAVLERLVNFAAAGFRRQK